MFVDERANLHIYNCRAFIMTLVLTATLALAGCDSTDTNEEPEIEALIISPSNVSIAVGEQATFSAVALTASGDTVRDLALRWWSSDPAVFTVKHNGVATGQAAGSAFCKVELTDEAASTAHHPTAAKRPFPGLDSAFVSVF